MLSLGGKAKKKLFVTYPKKDEFDSSSCDAFIRQHSSTGLSTDPKLMTKEERKK